MLIYEPDDPVPPGHGEPEKVGATPEPTEWLIFTNDERTVLFRMLVNPALRRRMPEGVYEVAMRDDSSHTWGPPIAMTLEPRYS